MLLATLLGLLAADPLPAPTVTEVMAAAPEAAWFQPDPEDTLYLDVAAGRIVILLVPELSPAHAAQVRTLARAGYYDGLSFYRVPVGFVAQGGDEGGERDIGEAAASLPAEFEAALPAGLAFTPLGHADGYAPEAGFVRGLPAGRDPEAGPERGSAWLAHCTGAFAFGREEGRDTASTEFYVTLQPQRYLDRNLTVLGRVVWGQEHLAGIARNEPGNFGTMTNTSRATRIEGLAVAADLPEAERVSIEVMDTTSEAFRQLIAARANRADAFFYHRPDHVDLCQMPVPVRLREGEVE
jgi:peptidylprolyl isomerase